MWTEEKVLKQGVNLTDVYNTIQAYMGGLFVNYYNDFGRTWQVYVEAEAPYRATTNDLGQFYVRNGQGQTVPLSALAKFETRFGPEFTMRYNEYRSAQINAAAAPGYSADQARAALVDVFKQTMPSDMGYDWMGMSYQEVKAEQGVPASVIFAFSLLFVFLILAALYESWTVPFSVLLSTPVAVFGALAALWLRRVVLGLFLPHLHGSNRERCLRADRPGDAHRPGCEKFDSDRRVCQGGLRARYVHRRCSTFRGEASLPAPHDDRSRLYSRLRAALDSVWSRCGGTPDYGHGGNWRHGRRDLHRQILCSGNLLCGRAHLRRRAAETAGP